MRSYKDVRAVTIDLPSNWVVHRHQLMDLEPHEATQVSHPVEPGWQLYFIEDLFSAVNQERHLTIDVGWYPDADPQGSYVVSLCSLRETMLRKGKVRLGPGDTIAEIRTRDLSEAVRAIKNFAKSELENGIG